LACAPNLFVESPGGIDISVDAQCFFFGFPCPSEEIVFYFIKRQLKPGTTVIADLAGGTGSFDDRFLVYIHVENVDGARCDAGAAHHAMVGADDFIE
jgi:hypothetical protein